MPKKQSNQRKVNDIIRWLNDFFLSNDIVANNGLIEPIIEAMLESVGFAKTQLFLKNVIKTGEFFRIFNNLVSIYGNGFLRNAEHIKELIEQFNSDTLTAQNRAILHNAGNLEVMLNNPPEDEGGIDQEEESWLDYADDYAEGDMGAEDDYEEEGVVGDSVSTSPASNSSSSNSSNEVTAHNIIWEIRGYFAELKVNKDFKEYKDFAESFIDLLGSGDKLSDFLHALYRSVEKNGGDEAGSFLDILNSLALNDFNDAQKEKIKALVLSVAAEEVFDLVTFQHEIANIINHDEKLEAIADELEEYNDDDAFEGEEEQEIGSLVNAHSLRHLGSSSSNTGSSSSSSPNSRHPSWETTSTTHTSDAESPIEDSDDSFDEGLPRKQAKVGSNTDTDAGDQSHGGSDAGDHENLVLEDTATNVTDLGVTHAETFIIGALNIHASEF